MAHRDRNQGFAFVYSNIASKLKKAEDFGVPVVTPQKTQSYSFAKGGSVTAYSSGNEDRVRQVKENLDRLQSLHHKLHAMLAELNQMTKSKKKSS